MYVLNGVDIKQIDYAHDDYIDIANYLIHKRYNNITAFLKCK